ncbi:MAG: hypothetical protein U1F87_09450 [Kiritimatiellia bacterium]
MLMVVLIIRLPEVSVVAPDRPALELPVCMFDVKVPAVDFDLARAGQRGDPAAAEGESPGSGLGELVAERDGGVAVADRQGAARSDIPRLIGADDDAQGGAGGAAVVNGDAFAAADRSIPARNPG